MLHVSECKKVNYLKGLSIRNNLQINATDIHFLFTSKWVCSTKIDPISFPIIKNNVLLVIILFQRCVSKCENS